MRNNTKSILYLKKYDMISLTLIYLSERNLMKGKVIRFNKKKGFGFIKSSDDKDVFFHYSSLVMEGFKDIAVDSEVEFDVEETSKGLRASNVKKIG